MWPSYIAKEPPIFNFDSLSTKKIDSDDRFLSLNRRKVDILDTSAVLD